MIPGNKDNLHHILTPEFFQHGFADNALFPDHCVFLVVGVIGVPQLTIWTELKLKKLMTKLALMTNIVSQVEAI